jgi:lipopolysaccharide export LptBFGC system permease protein LptF
LVVTIIASIFLGFVSFIFSVLTTQLAGADTRALAGLATSVLVIVVAGLWLFRDRLFGKPIE